jgi:hypothetical protein
MMDVVERFTPSVSLPISTTDVFVPPPEPLYSWDTISAVRDSLFTTPPDSTPYYAARADEDNPVKDSSSDEDSNEEGSASSDSSADKK